MPEMESAKRRVVLGSQTRRAESKKPSPGSNTLEPVLEYCELYPSGKGLWACGNDRAAVEGGKKKRAKLGMRILWKLRDGYVKFMNEVTRGAGYSGGAAFYGCPPGLEPSTNAWMTMLTLKRR